MRKHIVIFVGCFIVRFIFALSVGISDNYKFQSDSSYLVGFADNVLLGDFNFDYGRFITSPFFPVLVALFKLGFGAYWNIALVIFQLILSSISGIYIFRIAGLIFKNESVAIISTVIYGIFPLTFWYVTTFSQETLFQSLFIFSAYYLLVVIQKENYKALVYSALFFSLAYLTKSHILLFSLFIPILFYLNYSFKKALSYLVVFAGISIMCSLPYGMYHLIHNNTYVLSSNGSGFQFYLGNTNAGYRTIVDVPDRNSSDYRKMKDITNTAGYFNGNQSKFDSIVALPQSSKQGIFVKEGLDWIGQHPSKWIRLKIYDILLFLTPGISFRHYEFYTWLIAFICSVPLYVLAYIGMLYSIKKNSKDHFFIIGLFISMFLFSTVFYVQNRFRTITLEPFYAIYAGYALYLLTVKYKEKIRLKKE